MGSTPIVPTYRRGSFPRAGIHDLVTRQIARLQPESPKTWLAQLGASIHDSPNTLAWAWGITGGLLILTATARPIGLLVAPALAVAAIATIAKISWGDRGNPNRPDRLIVRASDIERFLHDQPDFGSTTVYAEALNSVMDANLDPEEYSELSSMLSDLLQSERDARAKRLVLQKKYDKLSGHNPAQSLDEAREDLNQETSLRTRHVLEHRISVLEKQKERRESLSANITHLRAQEKLAVELMRSVGESALQLETMPYVAIAPILESARDLVYAMDHEVLAVDSAVVEIELNPSARYISN